MASAISSNSASEVRIKYEDIPIKVYNIVHATGNNHGGGASGGFSTIEKTSILFCVSNAAIAPTIRGIAMQIKSKRLLSFIYIIPFCINLCGINTKNETNFNSLLYHFFLLLYIYKDSNLLLQLNFQKCLLALQFELLHLD